MKAVSLERLLPADFPPGERVLWFGRPEAVSLWRRAYRADWVTAWFGVMTTWNVASTTSDSGWFAGVAAGLRTVSFGLAALGILGFLAYLSARTTLYVVSQKRLVFKCGIALPVFINVPFSQINAANLRVYRDGTGDVALQLTNEQRIPYLALWPSARPLRFSKTEPMLRSVADARGIAETLGRALKEGSGGSAKPASESGKPGSIATAMA